MPSKTFVIGALEANHVAVKIFGYENPRETDPAEANWLLAEISVAAGVWSGRVREAFVTVSEVNQFREKVEALAVGDETEADFEPMEPHLVMKLSAEPQGRVQVSGVAFDEPEGVNAIAFNWQIDPKQLKALIKQLKDIEAEYPAR